jgi:hypothetical protein
MTKRISIDKTIGKRAAADRAGVSPSTITRAIARGELTPVLDAASDERIVVAELDKWAKAERRPGRKAQPDSANAEREGSCGS